MTENEGNGSVESYDLHLGIELVEQIQNYRANDNEMSNRMADGLMQEKQEVYNQYFRKWKDKDYKLYTENIGQEKVFAKEIYEKYNQTKDYNSYLEGILEQEDDRLGISIFANSESEDNYSETVIKKTAEKYKKLSGTKTEVYSYKWLEKISANEMPDILVILVLFIISMHLIFEDKKKNLFVIIRATPKGRMECIVSKMVAVVVSTVVVEVVIYGTMILFIGANYGLAGMNEAIQSTSLFISCPYHLQVWQFLLGIFWMKCSVYLVIALFILFISILSANYIIPFMAGSILVLANAFMYFSFSSVGKFDFIHYLNIWSFVKAEKILGNYAMIGINKNPISVITMTFLLITCLGVLLIVGNILLFTKMRKMPQYSLKLRRSPRKKDDNVISEKSGVGKVYRRLYQYEMYKIYVISGCAVVLLLFFLTMVISGKNTTCYLTPNQTSYQNQMQQLEGDLTDEKKKKILEKKAYYEDIFKQLEALEKENEEGKLSDEQYENMKLRLEGKLSLYPAFVRVYERYQYVSSHSGAKFVYEDGYKKMLGKMDHWYMNWIFIMLIVLIIMQSTVFTLDKERGMEKLIGATPRGRRDVSVCKYGIGIVNAIMVFIAFALRCIYIAERFYGMNQCTVSLSNIKGFENVPAIVSIVGALLLLGGMLLLLFAFVSVGIMIFSRKVGNAVRAVVVQLIVVVAVYLVINI